MDKINLDKIPSKPGVYLFKDENKKIIYIGKSKNLKNRTSSYFEKNLILGEKTIQLVRNIKSINYILVESEIEALLLEANLIQKYNPKYNIELKNGQKYPYIKITNEYFPRILLVRKLENDKSLYFGPYPNGTSIKKILESLRHIFPYCTHKKPYRSCLFIHLGICPGPNIIIDRKEYKRNVIFIKNFLKGKKAQVIKRLTKDMELASGTEDYRKAGTIKKQIASIEMITRPVKQPFEYLKNPNLVNDQAEEKIEKLAKFLNLSQVPRRIECYDVSNIGGKHAVGSMTVVINGQIDKNLNRRFKIKSLSQPDDTGMIEEVLSRRLKHQEWEYPDLIVIDGGKPQVNRAYEVLRLFNLPIPVIGLAKKMEEIYFANNHLPIPTNKDILVKLLLQEIRNEAHRFAHNYHLNLRSKRLFN